MTESLSRRAILAASAVLIPGVARAAPLAPWRSLAELEKQSGARIGVMAIDTANGNALFYRENERFLMCSTFKLLLAAAVLARADACQEDLNRIVHYAKTDLLDVSPVTTQNLVAGMKVEALCEAAVTVSDNAAANLLFPILGGPAGLTAWLRQTGDQTTRVDRIEPALNLPDGDKDTTTPVAMAGTLKALLLGDTLKTAARQKLLTWMTASTTGAAMLRAGLPSGWAVSDKTGRYVEGNGNAANDLAIITPPGRKPILVAAFTMNSSGDDAAHQAVLAGIGRIIAPAMV